MGVEFREPIAIVGIGCRFPGGAQDAEQYWKFLCNSGNGIREVPDDRWGLAGFYDPDPTAIARATTKWGGFLPDVRSFDPEFFGISSREANSMDPQQRLLMQVVYEALQDARLRIADVQAEKTGVFVGVSVSDYGAIQRMRRTNNDIYAGTGSALSIVSNRVSHRFDLSGPSYSVDTACSSSLVALDQACWNLNEGTCSRAISGGVNVLVDPAAFIAFSKAGMLSTTGTISTFDAAANGYVRGEGAGAVVLKRLSDARRDKDRIYAVIRATSVNQDGHTSTLTAPNPDRQVAMLETLCQRAGVDPADVQYVEAHGTGTPVGDPIEASALGRVFGMARDNERVLIGSVKPNIGHLESAAGISGLIKTALIVHNRAVPPNRNFRDPNPNIPFDLLGIEVPTTMRALGDGICRGAVNSFGFGGTNASALLESADAVKRPSVRGFARPGKKAQPQTFVPVPLSAATEKSLREYCGRVAAALAPGGAFADASLNEIAANLITQRDQFRHHAITVASSPAHLRALLTEIAEDRVPEPEPRKLPSTVVGRAGRRPKVAFTFAGQGGQWWGMARQLLTKEPAFRAAVHEFDGIFQTVSGWSVIKELKRSEAQSTVHDPAVTQPAIFAVQIGLAALWRKAGVAPDFIVGHSFGEVAAAYVAGALTLESAAQLIHKRGLIARHVGTNGGMLAVGLSADQVRDYLDPDGTIDIAAFNGPTMVTLSGDATEVEVLGARLTAERPDVVVRRLAMNIAWHSRALEPAEAWFRKAVGDIEWQAPSLPLVSTVTGGPETRLDAAYWWSNLRQPVAYEKAIAAALDFGAEFFLEIGPHRTLSGLTATVASSRDKQVANANSLLQNVDDFHSIAIAAATLQVSGVDIDWTAFSGSPTTILSLPKYAWDQIECWSDSEESRQLLNATSVHPLLGTRNGGPQVRWECEFNLSAMGYLADHTINGDVVFPAAGYMDMMLAAGLDYFGKAPIEVENLAILDALFITHDDDVLLRTTFEADSGRIRIFSHLRDSSGGWVERASARLRQPAIEPPPARKPRGEASAVRLDRDSFYALAARHGYHYGPRFQGAVDLALGEWGVEAKIAADSHVTHVERHPAHPAVLDSCMQTAIPLADAAEGLPLFPPAEDQKNDLHYPLYLPIGAERVRLFSPLPSVANVSVDPRKTESDDNVTDYVIADESGTVCLTIEGFRSQRMTGEGANKEETGAVPRFLAETFITIRAPLADSDGAATAVPGAWLVFPDLGGVCETIATTLAARGAAIKTVSLSDDEASDPDFVRGLIAEWLSTAGENACILVGRPLDTAALGPDADGETVEAAVERNVFGLLALGKALDALRETGSVASVWLLTQGARGVPNDPPMAVAGLAQAPMTGMMRTVAAECREFPHHHVDFRDLGEAEIATCISLMVAGSEESEVALRGDLLYVPRLDAPEDSALPRRPIAMVPGETDENFVATMFSPGSLDDIRLEQAGLQELAADHVRVAVEAVGLNFRDIMAATGLLPVEAEREPAWRNLGLEYAGTVVAAGSEVRSLSPGDKVMGMGRRCLQAYVDQAADSLLKVPGALSAEEAATVPSAFATAHYALNHVARLSEGERVLIHVATGGVGLAAIQLAKRAKAEIFATAGSDHKRSYLKSLGIHHVMNSRSLDFADRIMELTDGRGVDVVLNSLPGDFIAKGLDVMAPFGRFLEIGKRDVYMDSLIGMKALRRNVTLSIIDLAAMGDERPELLARLAREVNAMFAAGEVSALPTTVFPIGEVSEAFRYMSQARHIGKVVVSIPPVPVRVLSSDKPLELRADRSYLITGGSRGFGVAVADWLSARGAGRIIFASRSGKPDADAEALVAGIAERGTDVVHLRLDVTDASAVDEAVASLATGDKPLAGIIHGAAVIKDGFLAQLDPQTVRAVLRPKVLGGWNLHRALERAKADVDFFVSFSSLAQVLGSIGQANYVAANAFLDAFAGYRRGRGRAGQTIDWGTLGESGFVARSDAMTNYLESMGLVAVDNRDATGALERLLSLDVASIAFAAVDWSNVARAAGGFASVPRLRPMLDTVASGGGRVRAELTAASRDQWNDILKAFLVDQVAKVLRFEAADVDASKALTELGFELIVIDRTQEPRRRPARPVDPGQCVPADPDARRARRDDRQRARRGFAPARRRRWQGAAVR